MYHELRWHLAAALTLVVSYPMAVTAATVERCDLNDSGSVTTSDALALLQAAVGVGGGAELCSVDICEPDTSCPGNLQYVLGTWEFETTIISTFVDNYEFHTLSEDPCGVIGTDLDEGDDVGLIEASDAGYDYALLDPGSIICDFFLFDRIGANTVSGVNILLVQDGTGAAGCGDPFTGNENSMVGYRIASISSEHLGADAKSGVPSDLERRILEDSSRTDGRTSKAISTDGLERLLNRVKAAISSE